jgi:hypothetical protein
MLLSDVWKESFIRPYSPYTSSVQRNMLSHIKQGLQKDFSDIWKVLEVAVAPAVRGKGKTARRQHLVVYSCSMLANALCPEANGVQDVVGLMLAGSRVKAQVQLGGLHTSNYLQAFQVLNRMHVCSSRRTIKRRLLERKREKFEYLRTKMNSKTVEVADNVDMNKQHRNPTSDTDRVISVHVTGEALVVQLRRFLLLRSRPRKPPSTILPHSVRSCSCEFLRSPPLAAPALPCAACGFAAIATCYPVT